MTPEISYISCFEQFISGFSKLSPEDVKDLSTKYNSSGDTGHSGDKSNYVMEDGKEGSIATVALLFSEMHALTVLNYQILK